MDFVSYPCVTQTNRRVLPLFYYNTPVRNLHLNDANMLRLTGQENSVDSLKHFLSLYCVNCLDIIRLSSHCTSADTFIAP